MKVVEPLTVTDAMILVHTIEEPDSIAGETVWYPAAAYTAGQRVIRTSTHKVYVRVVSGTTSTPPEDDGANWAYYGPTNRWAMFDDDLSTLSAGAGSIVIVIAPGDGIDFVALLGVSGASAFVRMQVADAWPPEYDKTLTISGPGTLIFSGIPTDPDAKITICVKGNGSGSSIGKLFIGAAHDLGETKATPKLRYIDNSRVDGGAIVTGAYRKQLSCDVRMPNADFAANAALLERLRAPMICFWLTSDFAVYSPFNLYGFHSGLEFLLEQQTYMLASLEIETLSVGPLQVAALNPEAERINEAFYLFLYRATATPLSVTFYTYGVAVATGATWSDNWYLPTTTDIGDDWHVRLTSRDHVNATYGGMTFGTWYALTSDRTFTMSPTDSALSAAGVISVDFSADGGTTVIDGGSIAWHDAYATL